MRRRHFDVKRPAILQIAAPGQSLSAGGELQPGKVLDRAGGAVLAGNPLGIIKSQAPGFSGNSHAGMKDFSGRVGSIDRQGDLRGSCTRGDHR